MKTSLNKDGSKLLVTITGRIDTVTAPALEEEIMDNIDGVTSLVLDFKNVNYVSSAGLRVLLTLYERMLATGEMKLINVKGVVNDVFEITGFDEILTYEKG